jgi:hypothetical protein
MATVKLKPYRAGEHVHCDIYGKDHSGDTFGRAGTFTLRRSEFAVLEKLVQESEDLIIEEAKG